MSELPSDAVVAAHASGIYDYPGYDPIPWDHFEPENNGSVCWALRRIGDVDLVVLRGSVTPADWLLDFNAEATPLPLNPVAWICNKLGFALAETPEEHAFMGPVHPGFLAGMEAAWAAIRPWLMGRAVISGHSLGAARATILTALMIRDGVKPARRVTFGEPRPGFSRLAQITSQVPGASYQNGNGILVDPVTQVPLSIGFLNESFCHDRALTRVDEAPDGSAFESWGIMGWHSILLYQEGCEKVEGRPSSLQVAMKRAPELARRIPIN